MHRTQNLRDACTLAVLRVEHVTGHIRCVAGLDKIVNFVPKYFVERVLQLQLAALGKREVLRGFLACGANKPLFLELLKELGPT